MIALSILAYQERQPHLPQQRQQFGPPKRRTFRPRWQIGVAHCAGITKTHGGDRDMLAAIEGVPVHAQPIAQPIARGIVPGHAAFVDTPPWGLAGDQYPRFGMHPNDGARRMRQVLGAMAAGAYLRDERLEFSHSHGAARVHDLIAVNAAPAEPANMKAGGAPCRARAV